MYTAWWSILGNDKTSRNVASRRTDGQFTSRCRRNSSFLCSSPIVMSSVSTQTPSISRAVDHPIIVFLGSKGFSPSPLPPITWNAHLQEMPSTLCAVHHPPYLTSTEMVSSTKIITQASLSRLHLAPLLPGIPATTASRPSPSTPPRPHI